MRRGLGVEVGDRPGRSRRAPGAVAGTRAVRRYRLLPAVLLAALLTVAGALGPAVLDGSRLGAAGGPGSGPLGLLEQAERFAAPTTLAADTGIEVRTATRYTVQPSRRVIRAAVDIRATNRTPDRAAGGSITRFYFDGVNLGIQPDATHVRATQDGSAVPVHLAQRDGYRLLKVDFRRSIYFGQTASVHVTFDLAAGRPRSGSDVRVGRAFATFLAWAFGTQATVRIDIPTGFDVDVTGDGITRGRASDGGTVLRASPADPLRWYAWVNARNDDGLSHDVLHVEGGEQIIVRGWPEDARWRSRVGDLLTDGVPELQALIGLPWPVTGSLNVFEVHTALLEGYAGFYDPTKDQITISEDLDDLTIVHEASHAWFNQDLFEERWIEEGLADEYASRVLDTLGRRRPSPDAVEPDARVAFPLESWPPPAAIDDEQSSAAEHYGYNASWTLMRQIVTEVGVDGMRRVFDAAQGHTTAYVGDTAPERVANRNDWRRFLDLTEEVGGGDGIDDLLGRWVLPARDAAQLVARSTARDDYHRLMTTGGAWAPPLVVRVSMDNWSFADARRRIGAALAVLAERDRIASAASDAGLVPPAALESSYESASSDTQLGAVGTTAKDEEATLSAIQAAGDAAAAPRDWLTSLGLEGTTPDTDLASARTDWEQGELVAARELAAGAVAALEAAPELGRQQATRIGAGITGGLVIVLAILLLAWRARRRRRRARLAAASAMMAGGAWSIGDSASEPMPGPAPEPEPEPPDRYATLPPHPVGEDAPQAEPRTQEEGAERS